MINIPAAERGIAQLKQLLELNELDMAITEPHVMARAGIERII
jgi:hypothetical protein